MPKFSNDYRMSNKIRSQVARLFFESSSNHLKKARSSSSFEFFNRVELELNFVLIRLHP